MADPSSADLCALAWMSIRVRLYYIMFMIIVYYFLAQMNRVATSSMC